MSDYLSPVNNLLAGLEAALGNDFVDSDGNAYLRGALAVPLEVPMTCGCPYALLFHQPVTLDDNSADEMQVDVCLYFDAIESQTAMYEAEELAFRCKQFLAQRLNDGRFADGVFGGPVWTSDFGFRLSPHSPAGESAPVGYGYTLTFRAQWMGA